MCLLTASLIKWHKNRDTLMPPCFFITSALGHLRICPPLREFCNTLSCLFVSSICSYLLEEGSEFVLRNPHFLFIASHWFTMGRGSRYEESCRLWTISRSAVHLQLSLICKKRLTCIQEDNLVLFLLLDLHDLILLRNSFLAFGSLLLSLRDSHSL